MYDTDKIGSGLIEEYESLFNSECQLSAIPIKYLEVGIYRGGSLKWASDFFYKPDSIIVGIDRETGDDWKGTSKIKTYRADQNDGAELARIAGKYGEFDIIIDDGCHFATETENTFNALWPFVASGGVYIIEDWSAFFDHKDGAQYAGMPELIAKLMTNKTYHGIKSMRIINKENGMSYAAFWKR